MEEEAVSMLWEAFKAGVCLGNEIGGTWHEHPLSASELEQRIHNHFKTTLKELTGINLTGGTF